MYVQSWTVVVLRHAPFQKIDLPPSKRIDRPPRSANIRIRKMDPSPSRVIGSFQILLPHDEMTVIGGGHCDVSGLGMIDSLDCFLGLEEISSDRRNVTARPARENCASQSQPSNLFPPSKKATSQPLILACYVIGSQFAPPSRLHRHRWIGRSWGCRCDCWISVVS